MNTTIFITILSFYTLIIVGGIHYYEEKLKVLNENNRRLRNLKKSEYEYMTWNKDTFTGGDQ
jgi:hypothetical protein